MDLVVACLDSTSDLLQLPLQVMDILLMTSDDILALLMLHLQPVYVHRDATCICAQSYVIVLHEFFFFEHIYYSTY